jgi:hypothetical protein
MSEMNLDSLLDSSIDDLADLPEFQVYPNGVHKVIVDFEQKTVNNHPCIELKMRAVETIELADPTKDVPLNPGVESSVLFMLDNEFGQGKFKTVIKAFASHLGTSSIKDTVEAAKGMEVDVVCKVRQNKDKSQSYTDVTKVLF